MLKKAYCLARAGLVCMAKESSRVWHYVEGIIDG